MREDRDRWNRRYQGRRTPKGPSRLVKKFAGLAPSGNALDIAAGQGRNALFLAHQGFRVEAVDISEKALSYMAGRGPNLHPVCADLDRFDIPRGRYSLIINIRFLSRRLLPQIAMGLALGGVLIFEALLESRGGSGNAPRHPEYRLRANELLHAFPGLRVVYYRETAQGERGRPVAALVGIKDLVTPRRI